MSIYKILCAPEPTLKKKSTNIISQDKNLQETIDRMFVTMYKAKGIGLAAPQVGINKRLTVIDINGKEPLVLINPEIISNEGEQITTEGCLSVPGIFAEVKRSACIKLKALNRKGDPFEIEAEGLLADCIQHEIDHLDGTLFIDTLSSMKRSFLLKKYLKMQNKK